MANKPIIPVEIDDERFRQFYELFQQYGADVEKMPDDWKALNESAAKAHEAVAGAAGVLIESFATASHHASDLAENLKKAGDAQKDFSIASGEGEGALKKMGKEAKELSDTLFGIGKYLMKIGVLGVGSLVGSLFGIDKLAEGAVNNQRQARGLGMSTGQLRAFQTDLEPRYIDEGTLRSVADARNDLQKNIWLQKASGLSADQLNNTDAGSIAAQLAIKAHDWWAGTPSSQHNVQFLQATGFPQSGISLDQMRQWGNTDRSELTRARDQYHTDASTLNVSDKNTDSLYDFMRDVKLAGSNLETYFTNKLAQLGPSLGDFVTHLEKDAELLLNGVLTPDNLTKIQHGIESFAGYLGSDEFRKSASEAVEDFKVFTHALEVAAKFIANLFPDSGVGKEVPEDQKPLMSRVWDFAKSFKQDNDDFFKHTLGDPVSSWYKGLQKGSDKEGKSSVAASVARWYGDITGHDMGDASNAMPIVNGSHHFIDRAKADALFGRLEGARGLPNGVMDAIALNESHFDASAVSNKHAQGLFQTMPGVSSALGLTDPFNWIQSSLGGATLFEQLQTRYKGDIRKELAAWNWRPGALDADIKTHGKDWERHAPQETQNFISRVLRTMQLNRNSSTVNLTITNKSGTDVAISTNAGAAG